MPKVFCLPTLTKYWTPIWPKRRGKNVKLDTAAQNKKIVKDILDVWEVIDKHAAGKLQTQFVAVDINRIPAVNADKFSLQFLISSILKLQETTEALKEKAAETSSSVDAISDQLIQVNRRLDK